MPPSRCWRWRRRHLRRSPARCRIRRSSARIIRWTVRRRRARCTPTSGPGAWSCGVLRRVSSACSISWLSTALCPAGVRSCCRCSSSPPTTRPLAALKRDVPAAFAGGDPGPGETTTVQLDPHAAAEFLRRANAAGGAKAIASPQLLVNEGQRGSILIGGEVPYVQGFNTVKDNAGNVAYEPTIQYAPFGLSLDVTATADGPGTQTSLQLESRMSKFAGMKEKSSGKTVAGEPLVVQEPQMARSEVKAAATVPVCHTLLVRGLRGSPEWMHAEAPDGGGRADAEAGDQRAILLLVKSGVITPDATN